MLTRKPKPVLYRRKREQKTDYGKRLHLLLANKPRLVVRMTNQKLIGQLVEFTPQGDKVLESVDSFALKKLGWTHSCKNFPAAYLTGLLLGRKIQKRKIKEAVLDTGFINPLKKGKIYAFLKGGIDGGLNVPHHPDILPDESRVKGKHIQNKAKPEEIAGLFEQVKKKILSL
ncbi:MAG TPA: 50S ribosomal protein L18 [Candidatus Nanoarchaeia archaeon]|nr:50S ribosomal protein L18 [Candidatus Nanoarchaeia archaeon]